MSPRGGGMRAVAALCAALAAAVLLAFSPVLDNGFLAYDDQSVRWIVRRFSVMSRDAPQCFTS